MKKCLIGIVSLMCLSAVPVIAAEKPITIFVDQGNPPFMSADEKGEAVGLYPELIRAVFKKAQLSVIVKAAPWKRCLQYSQSGKGGMGGIYKNSERLKIYDYSDKLFDETITIFKKADSPLKFEGIADLKGKTIGVIRGWSYGDQIDEAIKQGVFKTSVTEKDEQNIRMTNQGKVDAAMALKASGGLVIKTLGLQGKIVPLPKPVNINPTYIVFAKSEHKAALIQKINAALKQIKDDGTYQKIYDQFLK